jgi:hemerythrin-like domain-containing protein
MEEHRVIERVLASLEKQAHKLNAGDPVRASFFRDVADFVRNFADGCHHNKEEGVLFPAMVASGVPEEAGPIAVMLAEHEEGRGLTRAMRKAAERLERGESQAAPEVARNGLAYASMLRQHILKEDNILYPMAEQAIPKQEQESLAAAFERIEQEERREGVQRKYLELAAKLEAEAG